MLRLRSGVGGGGLQQANLLWVLPLWSVNPVKEVVLANALRLNPPWMACV